jgi:hypothetical protein
MDPRLAGITRLEPANAFLPTFIKRFNCRSGRRLTERAFSPSLRDYLL